MIDDGKNDPPEVKIEDLPWSVAQFDLWEHELRIPKPKQRKRSRLRKILTAFGNALTYPQINPWGFF
jgi:hypothetical protein